MKAVENYKKIFVNYMNEKVKVKNPVNLYQPIQYMLDIGGKRLRPILTLLTCDLFGEDVSKALNAALAVEVFHNFTLVHDDIMDNAALRRGKSTVFKKWNVNTGVLSGDAMLILAYQFLENYDAEIFKKLIMLFNQTALEVCEGQQLDMDFETRLDVTIPEYLQMISYKTSVLVAAAMKMGAIIANANEKDTSTIYDFGLNLGIAFQLQDDYLDTFGDTSFGKQIGGDIIENKKTFLILKTLEIGSEADKELLLKLYNKSDFSEDKVKNVTEIFIKNKAPELIKNEIENYTNKAFKSLEKLPLNENKKNLLKQFGIKLMNRTL